MLGLRGVIIGRHWTGLPSRITDTATGGQCWFEMFKKLTILVVLTVGMGWVILVGIRTLGLYYALRFATLDGMEFYQERLIGTILCDVLICVCYCYMVKTIWNVPKDG